MAAVGLILLLCVFVSQSEGQGDILVTAGFG